MSIIFDEKAPKRAANLSVNSDLLKKAKELEINLSLKDHPTLSSRPNLLVFPYLIWALRFVIYQNLETN